MSASFPVIDPVATGQNIVRLRNERGLSVRDLQAYFGFEEPQAIYKWQRGKSLPSVDNLFALGAILEVSLDEILVPVKPHLNIVSSERQAESCRSAFLLAIFRGWRVSGERNGDLLIVRRRRRINRLFEIRQKSKRTSAISPADVRIANTRGLSRRAVDKVRS